MDKLKYLLALLHDYTGYSTDESREINHAIQAAMEEQAWLELSEKRYQELREIIDGGSESMNHDDALKQCKYWSEVSGIANGLTAKSSDGEIIWFLQQTGHKPETPVSAKELRGVVNLVSWNAKKKAMSACEGLLESYPADQQIARIAIQNCIDSIDELPL